MKKAGRMDPEMPVKYLRVRFVYLTGNPDIPLYGEWMDVEKVMRQAMFPNEDWDVAYIEFETREARNVQSR
jgi:hypothetical protein